MLEVSRGSDEDWCKEGSGDRLQEYVEDRIVGRRKSAKIEIKIWHGKPAWKRNESRCVRGLLMSLEVVHEGSETGCTDEEERCEHDHRDAEHVDCDIDGMLMI